MRHKFPVMLVLLKAITSLFLVVFLASILPCTKVPTFSHKFVISYSHFLCYSGGISSSTFSYSLYCLYFSFSTYRLPLPPCFTHLFSPLCLHFSVTVQGWFVLSVLFQEAHPLQIVPLIWLKTKFYALLFCSLEVFWGWWILASPEFHTSHPPNTLTHTYWSQTQIMALASLPLLLFCW